MFLTRIYDYSHGDSSVYAVIVRMAQYFQMYPIYTVPQGNYGGVDGDDAAAYRYTETTITRFCNDAYFKYWCKKIIDFKPNYNNEKEEPEYLFSIYPMVLLKGSFGLGYGLYTGIPPFNLTEVLKTVIKLIKNPKAKIDLLPDFPLPCNLVSTDFNDIFEKGEGNFRVRGIIEEDEGSLIIKSIPYQTNTANIVEDIVKLIKDKKIQGIKDIVDHSKRVKVNGFDQTDINIELELKPGAPVQSIKDTIFKATAMEQTFAVNFELVDGTENIHYNLRSLLLDWIDFNREMRTRLALYEYKTLSKDYHMKLTVVDILKEPDSDKVILGIMRNNRNKKEQARALAERYSKYKLTELQAKVILEWKLHQYSQETIDRIVKETGELKKELKKKKEEIYNVEKIDENIISDMNEGIKKYGRGRVSEVIEVRDASYVEDREHLIVITKKGYIKKLREFLNEGVDRVGTLEQGDKILHLLYINNRDSLLLFDSKGKCYKLPVDDIESSYKDGIGTELSSYINTDEKIISVMEMPSKEDSDCNLLFVSKNGIIKKSSISNYMGVNKAGLIGVALKSTKDNKDSVVDVIKLGRKQKDILLYTANGKAIRFNTKQIPTTLRMSSGVIGIKLQKGDMVTGMMIVDKSKEFLTVLTNTGKGKKYSIEDLEKSERGKEGSNLIRMKKDEKIIGIKAVNSDEDIDITFNNRTETLNVKDFPKLTLIAEGKPIVKVKRGEHLISID